jgi:hypothetical protein
MEPTMHFRWLISHRNDYERVLQQLWKCDLTGETDWRNVPEVIEPRQIQPEAESGMPIPFSLKW